MKIVAFSNIFPPINIGGYEIGASQILEELRNRGHEVLLLSAHEYYNQQAKGYLHRIHEPADKARMVDVGLCVFGSLTELRRRPLALLARAWQTFWARRNYLRRVEAFRPDAFLVFNPLGVVAPVLDDFVAYSRRTGAKVHAYVSDHWVAYWPLCNPLWCLIFRIGLSKRWLVKYPGKVLTKILRRFGWVAHDTPLIDSYFYCSDFVRQCSLEKGIGLAHHEVAHWGLPGVERLPSAAPDHFNGSSPLTILFAGQLLPHKGLKVLLRALVQCKKPHRLVVIGDDATDHASDCKRLAAKLGLGDRVLFAGRKKHEEMLELMARTGQVLVVPSEWDEPFSIVVIEGMGIGLPVIASQTGGTGEGVEDGENGFLFPRYDSQTLAGVIDRLEADRSLCQRVGARARQDVLRRYTMKRLVDQVEAQLLNGNRPALSRAA